MGGQEGCHDVLVLDGRDRAGRVHEGTAGLDARSLRRRGCRAGARASASGRPALRQRASGREASVPRSLQGGSTRTRSKARRRVVASASAVRTSTIVAPMRCGGPAQRLGAAGVLLDGDDLALVAHQRREVGGLAAGRGAQVEHALAGLRARARARRPSRRATAASAGPSPTRARRRCRTGASRISASGRRRRAAGQALGELAAVVLSVLARSDGLGGLVVGGHQRAARSRRRTSSNHSSAIHSRVRVRERGLLRRGVGERGDERRAPRATARRSTALTRPAPRGASRLASSTDSPTAACAGTRSRKVSWKTPRRSAASTGASSLAAGRRGKRLDHVVERGHALDGAVAELRGQREIARVQPQALRLAVQRAVGPRALLEHAPHDRVRARARGGDDWGLGTDGTSSLARAAFTCAWSSDWLRRIAPRLACGAPHTEVQIPVSFLKFESGLFAALSPSCSNVRPKTPSADSICPKRANGPRTTCRHLPMEGDATHVGH